MIDKSYRPACSGPPPPPQSTFVRAFLPPRFIRLSFFAGGVALALLTLGAGTTLGTPLAAWDLTGSNSAVTADATIFNANLDSADTITRGAGAPASTGANSFRTVGFKNNGISTTNTDYFQITLSAASGYTMSLSTIDAQFNGTATFVTNNNYGGVSAQFAYSTDGTNFTLIGSPFVLTNVPPVSMPPVALAGVTALQDIPASTTVYLRYYATGQTSTGGWGFYSSGSGVYGLNIGGTATSSCTAPTITGNPSNYTVCANSPAQFTGTATGATSYKWRKNNVDLKIGRAHV